MVQRVSLEQFKINTWRQHFHSLFIWRPGCHGNKEPCKGTVNRAADTCRNLSYVEHVPSQVCHLSHGAKEDGLNFVPGPHDRFLA